MRKDWSPLIELVESYIDAVYADEDTDAHTAAFHAEAAEMREFEKTAIWKQDLGPRFRAAIIWWIDTLPPHLQAYCVHTIAASAALKAHDRAAS